LLIDPCGLWHDEQLILPSRTGMWATARSVLVTWTRWHVAHKAVSVAFTNWCSSDFGWWTLWQVVQERFPPVVRAAFPGRVVAAVVARQA
jgi:hypothetical protein